MNRPMETKAFLWLLLLVSVGFFLVIVPFFGPVLWATAVAIIFYPMQVRLLEKLPNRKNLTALITLLACIIIVVIPVIFVIVSVITEGVKLYEQLDTGYLDIEDMVRNLSNSYPLVQSAVERFDIDVDNLQDHVAEAVMASGKFVAEHTFDIGQNLFKFAISLAIMIYLTFFLLRDGSRILEKIVEALPFGSSRDKLLLQKFTEVTRATVKGNIIIAIIQGAQGAFIFWVLGIPAAILWGSIMAVLSLIPAVGAALIWGPVAIYLYATGDLTNAIILTAFGGIIIGLTDNLLRPILVGRDTKLPDYIVLLSTLGGIVLFGINGFVVGPLIAALFIVSWGIFVREFNTLDEPEPPL